MRPKSAIEKGKELEKYVLGLLEPIFAEAKRQPGSGSGLGKWDIVCGNWTIECKNTKTFKWGEAAKQIAGDTFGIRTGVVVWHPPHTPLHASIAIINVHDLVELLQKAQEPKTKESLTGSRELRYKTQSAVNALKALLKEWSCISILRIIPQPKNRIVYHHFLRGERKRHGRQPPVP
jgi:hypothetical protein